MSDRPRPDTDPRTGKAAAARRMAQPWSWVDQQIRQAQERGDFDDLPGAGRPIDDLGRRDDPDWWVKRLVEREQITGVLPPALQLRKDEAELEATLDALTAEPEVRRVVTDFNDRIRHALLTNLGGPPVITEPRKVDAEVEAWRARRRERAMRAAQATRATELGTGSEPKATRRRSWFRRG